VLVEAHGGGRTGLGWTYGNPASATVIRSTLAHTVQGRDALRVSAAWEAMAQACRNRSSTPSPDPPRTHGTVHSGPGTPAVGACRPWRAADILNAGEKVAMLVGQGVAHGRDRGDDPTASIPPLPTHIAIEQAQWFMYALLGGDPKAGQMLLQSAKQKLEEFLPGR
jgi:hypothetical protein